MLHDKDSLNKHVHEFVSRSLAAVDGIQAIYLVGDYARGTAIDGSDIEIAVVTERYGGNDPLKVVNELDQVVWGMRDVVKGITVHPIHPEDLKSAPLGLDIEQFGQLFWSDQWLKGVRP